MPEHTRPIQRLVELHGAFARKRKLSWKCIQQFYRDYLSEEFSKRTVYMDIARLRDQFGAPIVNENNKFYYEKEFSLLGLINPEEFKLAEEAGHLLFQLSILPPLAGMEEIHFKIREWLRKPSEQLSKPVDFERNERYKGWKWIHPVYECIQKKETVKITYQDFGKNPRTFSMSPYLVKEYRNRWHIYGFEHTRNRIYNLALDRILQIQSSEFVYRVAKPGELGFLDEIMGFTFTYHADRQEYAAVETIDLAIRQHRAHYVRTKPLHSSQRESKDLAPSPDWVVFRLELRQNRELVAAILEFGQDAWVLSPASLQEKVKEHLQGMMALYQTDSSARE